MLPHGRRKATHLNLVDEELRMHMDEKFTNVMAGYEGFDHCFRPKGLTHIGVTPPSPPCPGAGLGKKGKHRLLGPDSQKDILSFILQLL